MDAGDVLGIIGPNGAGKTTLMKVLLGFLKPDVGTVHLFGQDPRLLESKKYIGYLPEQMHLYRYLSGAEFLEYCGELYGMDMAAIHRGRDYWLARLGLEEAARTWIGTYSKGMQQRLGLASTLLHAPKLVFLDEPMSGLDPLGRALFCEVLTEIQEAGTSIILNSHILSDIATLCSRVLVLHKGRVLGERSMKTLKKAETLEHYFLDVIRTYDQQQEKNHKKHA